VVVVPYPLIDSSSGRGAGVPQRGVVVFGPNQGRDQAGVMVVVVAAVIHMMMILGTTKAVWVTSFVIDVSRQLEATRIRRSSLLSKQIIIMCRVCR